MAGHTYIGIEYADQEFNYAALADGRIRPKNLPDLFDTFIYVEADHGTSILGVGFPSLLGEIGNGDQSGIEFEVEQILQTIRADLERESGKEAGSTVIAVPTGLTSGRRSAVIRCAQAAGFKEVALVDALLPSGLAYSGGSDAPTTQLIYYLGYGECEYALLRVVRGKIKVIDSGITNSISGQSFDLQLMESIILALREKNVFLGLRTLRKEQWLDFRRVVAKARDDLGKSPVVELTLPPNLLHESAIIRIELSAKAWAARMAPEIRATIKDIRLLLEKNEIRPTEIDAVVALGNTATRYPVDALLAEAFPDKIKIGVAETVAATAAAYAESLDRSRKGEGESKIDLSYFLSDYQENALLPIASIKSSKVDLSVVTAISIEQGPTNHPAPPVSVPRYEGLSSEVAASSDAAASALSSDEVPGTQLPDVAKRLIDEKRYLEAAQILLMLTSVSTPPPKAETSSGDAQIMMQQSEGLLARGLYLQAVAMAHQAYDADRADGKLLNDMLRIHLDATKVLDQPEHYAEAIRILMCANSHDPTNSLVRVAIALRHCQHAKAILKSDPLAAKEAVTKAARFSPDPQQQLNILDRIDELPNLKS